jgi:adenylate cyclase class IV
MKNIEVEFRFQVTNESEVRDFLNRLTFLKRISQNDVYYDTESGDFFKRGIFMRSRNGKALDFKFNLEDEENKHEDCNERSFPLPISGSDLDGLKKVCDLLGLKAPDAADMEEFMRINSLREFVVIDKVREEFSDDEFVFCLDDVKGFGKFLEIEAMASPGSDLKEIKERMIKRVSVFNPKFLPTGYIELVVKKKNLDLYKQGRYLLEEDKN